MLRHLGPKPRGFLSRAGWAADAGCYPVAVESYYEATAPAGRIRQGFLDGQVFRPVWLVDDLEMAPELAI